MLVVKDLSKSFDHTPILDHINFSIQINECVGLIGKNGAGKSTLLKTISRVASPDAGQIQFEGKNVLQADHQNRSGLLYIGHSPGFYPSFTGIENLLFFSTLHQGITALEKIKQLLMDYGLEKYSGKQIKVYSQGMIQRLKLALTELIPWKLLLIDEPFNALDISGIEKIKHKFLELKNENRSILFVDHDLNRVLELSTRILLLKDRKIVLDRVMTNNEKTPDIFALMN